MCRQILGRYQQQFATSRNKKQQLSYPDFPLQLFSYVTKKLTQVSVEVVRYINIPEKPVHYKMNY